MPYPVAGHVYALGNTVSIGVAGDTLSLIVGWNSCQIALNHVVLYSISTDQVRTAFGLMQASVILKKCDEFTLVGDQLHFKGNKDDGVGLTVDAAVRDAVRDVLTTHG